MVAHGDSEVFSAKFWHKLELAGFPPVAVAITWRPGFFRRWSRRPPAPSPPRRSYQKAALARKCGARFTAHSLGSAQKSLKARIESSLGNC